MCWITEPPIHTYTATDWVTCRRLARELKRDLEAWGDDITDKTSKYHPGNAQTMCDTIHDAFRSFGQDNVAFAYMYAGRPLGLMLIAPKRKDPYVIDLVSHPGTEGCGAILCEFALNYLKTHGHPQRLKLWALNNAAVGPYRGMGFKSQGEEKDMLLDPHNVDKWQLIAGRWRYTSANNPGTKYAARSLPW